jgi:hypothetical protein
LEQLNHHGKPMTKTIFDESKLTDEQRKAIAIARAQGAPFSRTFEDLCSGLDAEDADELADAIEENRRRDRQIPTKSFF